MALTGGIAAAVTGGAPLPAAAEPVQQADLGGSLAADDKDPSVNGLDGRLAEPAGPGQRSGRGSAAGGPTGREDALEFGETGTLFRLVDDAARQRALTPPPSTRAAPKPLAGSADVAGNKTATLPFALPPLHDDNRSATAADRRGEAPVNHHSEAVHALVDSTTAEQRNVVREALAFVRGALQHPAGWAVLGLVGVASLMVSAASRRDK